MKSLSIKNPWAHSIIHLGKDIENRDWKTNMRGTIAVHASKSMTKDEMMAFIYATTDFLEVAKAKEVLRLIDPKQMPFGAIIGTVEIIDCVTKSDSPWFFGDYGFVLKNPKPLREPIYCNGTLGFWNVPAEIEKQILERL